MKDSKTPLKMYYDGLCGVCLAEVLHYRKKSGSENIDFIDITLPEFDAHREGLDPVQVHKQMHARRPDGTIAVGVDAFIAIWETLPTYRWAAKIARRPVPHFFLNIGYVLFAAIRPYLPRKKRDCSQSPYCDTK